ncbi:MAG: Lrp/AsnC family transcriptional regulator [Burkholderiales bacterium]|jgi:Lrp/AsnC family leucine-responsive transcriptional regulator|nr:Lrp/AsnC family transcriptional regulator [Burkholderiales bacterium]
MKPSPIELDATDRRLLALLQDDCAQTNDLLASRAHVSPATSLRRVRRLVEAGVIERRIAIVNPAAAGGVTAIVEVTLEQQSAELLDHFEAQVAVAAEVQQCYRVASGPDFVLVVLVPDVAAYHAFAHRVLTAQANVRNVRSFFAVKRGKFEPKVPL